MKNIGILGGGESGVGAALLAQKKGMNVFLSDAGRLSDNYRKELEDNNIPFEEGGHTLERLSRTDVVIKSPGVPGDAPPCKYLLDKGIKIISEIELGSYFYSGKIIAITGSNGKTTTSGLIYHLLQTARIDVGIGGNYGTSFCRLLCEEKIPAWMVLEVSSFQLDDIDQFNPSVAILLNVTPDHLDRYQGDVMQYGRAKMRIIENQNENDVFIYNGDDKISNELINKVDLNMKTIRVKLDDYSKGIHSKELDALFEINLIGTHNLFNAYCAIQVARLVDLDDSIINLGLKTFNNAPHRLETIAVINGVKYINDSKATNVDAVSYALEGIEQPIIWIVGGTDKGNDYNPIMQIVSEKVKAIICLGLDNSKLIQSFQSIVPVIEESQSMDDAIRRASKRAGREEVVLLSPACASFDLFRNYIDRGEQFRTEVWKLIK